MDPSQPAPSRRRTTAILAAAGLACLAIAIPVSGAFGADESGSPNAAPSAQQQGYGPPDRAPGPDGQGQPPRGAPRGDCPKHRGETPGSSGNGSSGESSAPGVPGESLAL